VRNRICAQASKKRPTSNLAPFFDPKEGDSEFLRNVYIEVHGVIFQKRVRLNADVCVTGKITKMKVNTDIYPGGWGRGCSLMA
jgi:hypothetical protein